AADRAIGFRCRSASICSTLSFEPFRSTFMRLVFAGTPAAALPTLNLLAASHEVAAVITRPDAPLGRKRVLTPSPIAQAAEELQLPVIKAARLDDEATGRV